MQVDDLRYYDDLLGHWEIRYPNADGMANMNYAESLELRPDGIFSWAPCPLWAKPGGRWGVIGRAETQQFKLYFEERHGGSFRGEWLVVTPLKFGGKAELLLHWQRTVSDAVVFADRILIARLIGRNTATTDASDGRPVH
jgi:hypothetical protein